MEGRRRSCRSRAGFLPGAHGGQVCMHVYAGSPFTGALKPRSQTSTGHQVSLASSKHCWVASSTAGAAELLHILRSRYAVEPFRQCAGLSASCCPAAALLPYARCFAGTEASGSASPLACQSPTWRPWLSQQPGRAPLSSSGCCSLQPPPLLQPQAAPTTQPHWQTRPCLLWWWCQMRRCLCLM